MVADNLSERQAECTQISETLALGAVDRTELLRMVKKLSGLAHDLSWDVKAQLRGRNDTPVMQEASRWVASAQSALTWAERNAQYVLTFELARCIEVANSSALKVLDALQLQGAAA